LYNIKADYQHRILIGGDRTRGHGVAKLNELAADIAREDSDKVIDAIRSTKRFFETDAFLLVASTAGGTGSGTIPTMIQRIKERYIDKPVYALLVLPFEHEEATEERTVYNTAVCLKSAYTVADAVFLVDNQRYVKKDVSLRNNISKINELIVEPFYNILCAGEEKKAKYIGTKMLDAGDIMHTISGWTAVGYGTSPLPLIDLRFFINRNFREKSSEIHKGIQTMDKAISELTIQCNPNDSTSALYLITAPAKEMNVDLIKELGDALRSIAPEAIIRNGDYPRERGEISITVILSRLNDVAKIRDYYGKASGLMESIEKKQEALINRPSVTEDESGDIPTLL
jgi:cell division GTPase FtsZ